MKIHWFGLGTFRGSHDNNKGLIIGATAKAKEFDRFSQFSEKLVTTTTSDVDEQVSSWAVSQPFSQSIRERWFSRISIIPSSDMRDLKSATERHLLDKNKLLAHFASLTFQDWFDDYDNNEDDDTLKLPKIVSS